MRSGTSVAILCLALGMCAPTDAASTGQPQAATPAAKAVAAPTPSLAADDPKYVRVRRVYDRIVRAWSSGRPAPRLVVRPASDEGGPRIALYRPDTTSVEIDEAVVDLCGAIEGGQDNALAVLLGHELAHYFREHGWAGDFGARFADLDFAKALKAAGGYDRLIRNETEADSFGIFYAYVAGYDALTSAPAVFDAVYQNFKLADKLGGYPSREERKKIVAGKAAELRGMQDLFDAARTLLLLEQHAAAAAIYDRLTAEFPGREMLNNAAVARIMQALASIGLMPFDAAKPQAWALAHPVLLEMQSRLGVGRGAPLRSKGPDGDEAVMRLLGEAGALLEKAVAMDGTYVPALVNLAVVESLSGKHELAAAHAAAAIKSATAQSDASMASAARTMRAIALYGQATAPDATENERAEWMTQARALWTQAAAAGNTAAQANIDLLDGKGRAVPIAGPSSPSTREKIGGLDFRSTEDLEEKHDREVSVIIGGSRPEKLTLMVRAVSGGSALLAKWNDRTGERTVLMVWAGEGSPARTSRGLGINSTAEQVHAALGMPARTLEGSRGTYEVYPGPGLIFEIDRAGVTRGWGLYGQSE